MKNLLFFCMVACSMRMNPGMFGFSPGGYAQASGAQIQNTTTGEQNAPNTQQQNCPSADGTTVSLPPFIISLYGSNSITTPINSIAFPTNNFLTNNALLIVHIFPPSNIITSKAVTTPQGSDNSYAIVYTLKSLNGQYIQKVLQYATAAAGSTPATSVLPISQAGVPTIPTAISISTATLATPTVAVTPPILAPTTFIPNFPSTSNPMTQQRILNAISPLNQKFLISASAGTINSLTPISGIFDTEDASTPTLISSFVGQSANISPTIGTAASSIAITISDNNNNPIQTVTFAQKNLPFTTQDLTNGLALNIHIFPPSTGSSSAEYFAFATLRTLDGLKLHKLQFPAFTTQPAQFSINYGAAATPQFSTIFINTNINTQALNVVSPINLRCLLQSNSSGIVTISMM